MGGNADKLYIMAIKLETEYPGRTTVNVGNPNGTFKNSDPPGSLNGTPGDFAWAKDMWSFLEILMSSAGITHNNIPDDANDSQRYEALLKLARDIWPQWDSAYEYSAGVIVVGSDNSPYYSLQDSNINNDPVSEPSWWRDFSYETLRTAARTAWPIWDSAETYPAGVGIVYGGEPYYSLQSGNLNKTPDVEPTWWQLFSYANVKSDARNVWPIWDGLNTYIKGALVIGSDEKNYKSLQNSNIGNDPTVSPAWWEELLGETAPLATATIQGITLLRKRILTRNTAADQIIYFDAGNFIFDDYSGEAYLPVWTKNITNVWAQGTGNGGRAAGVSLTTDFTYHFFGLSNADGSVVDVGFDSSTAASNLLSDPNVIAAGLTKAGYIGAAVTQPGSAVFYRFRQSDRFFEYNPRILENTYNFITVPTGPNFRVVTTPLDVKTRAKIEFSVFNQGGRRHAYITDPDSVSITPTESPPKANLATNLNTVSSVELDVTTNIGRQISELWDSGANAGDYTYSTIGFEHLELKSW